jgi:UDP-N-acetylmuramoylalanine--D-glutamate ligase
VLLAEPGVRGALAAGVPVVGDVELFARALPASGRPKIAAVTGTNGKTTVTALAGAMAKAAGADCEVAGNIGPAVLDALMRCEDEKRVPGLWVLELSSFQLETTATLGANVATVLNLSEDHLDRYRGLDDYVIAKARIFQGEGIQVLNRGDPHSISMALPGRTTISFGLDAPSRAEDWGLLERDGDKWLAQGSDTLMRAGEIRLAGLHNVANVLAALALCRSAGLPLAPLLTALRGFKGLPHRVEMIGEARGVSWYDDSKGTNVGATVAALAGLAQGEKKIVLIAGGEGKGQDFSPLKSAVARSARSIVLIGRDALLIEAAVAGSGVPVLRAASMEEAVQLGAAQARPGDVVLLSPACASFDMFRNYGHRGEVFRTTVESLIHARTH